MSLPTHIQALGWTAFALVLTALAACTGEDTRVADGGIRGTGSSVGPVSGFGSVFVNGVRFSTDDIASKVTSNDGVIHEDDLKKGMILRVRGEWHDEGTGQAKEMIYDDTFRGPLDSYQALTKTVPEGHIIVLGQKIRVDRRTVVESTKTLEAGLPANQMVRVSAWRDGSGYRASYIGLVAGGAEDPKQYVELEGPITDADQDKFKIGTQQIIFLKNTKFLDGVSAQDLTESGRYLEVEGELQSGVLYAHTIRPSDDRRFSGDEGNEVEFSGPIEALDGLRETLKIHGVIIDYSGISDEDFHPDRLKNGKLVEVEGVFRDGKIIAEDIEILEGEAEVEGNITPCNIGDNSLKVGGVDVRITSRTLIDFDGLDFEDGAAESICDSRIKSVEVEGIERKDATTDRPFIEAVYIEAGEDEEGEFELVGRLASHKDHDGQKGTLTVLGLELHYDQTTDFDVEDNVDWRECSLLEVEYKKVADGEYLATEVECEDEEH